MAASGIISVVQEKWRVLIASTTAFQTWKDGETWDLTEAKDHVHHDQMPDPDDGNAYTADEMERYLPLVVVWTAYARGFQLHVRADGDSYYGTGQLVAEFYRIPDLKIDDNPDETFRNWMGSLLQSGDTDNPGIVELARKSGQTTSYLVPSTLTVHGPLETTPKEDPQLGRVQIMRLECEWPSTP